MAERSRYAAAGAVIAVAVVLVYHAAPRSYFFNDDFQWLAAARRFDVAHLARIGAYDHFYRPVVEIYFFAAERMFGCRAAPFHVASIGIHLLNSLVLFLLVRALTKRVDVAFLAALFFAVQPGSVEAVVWVAAITDLLPALWYLLTLWLYTRFLDRREARAYGASLVTFTLCLLTHEVSATLLPVMLALDWLRHGRPRRIRGYAPFAVLVAASLAIAYVVNSRSYLVREGHWRIGLHAVPNALRYIVTLPVWTGGTVPFAVTTVVIAALLAVGSPRVRFAIVWLVAAIAPAAFFTWGNVSRYLYLPSAPFALLLADAAASAVDALDRRVGTSVARLTVGLIVAAVVARFVIFATLAADAIAERAQPYARFANALHHAAPSAVSGDVIVLDAADAAGIGDLYRQPAADAAYCTDGIRVRLR